MQHVAMDKLKGRQVIKARYDNFIGGKWVAPVRGQYFTNVTPITGQPVCEIARSTAEDIELALDAAHKVRESWGNTSPAERARVLAKIATRMEENLDVLALVETIDNGKPIRETTHADVPLVIVKADGRQQHLVLRAAIETSLEVTLLKSGGLIPHVLSGLLVAPELTKGAA